MWVQTAWGVFEVKNSFSMYNTIFVYIFRVPVSMKGSKGHQKSRKQRKQTGFKELAHICVLCSAIASPSLLSSSPIRVNPNCHCRFVFSGPGWPGPWRLVFLPPPPLPFFVSFFQFFFVLFPLPPPGSFFFPLAFCLFAALFFCFFCLPWCAGPAVFRLVCVSCAVGCAGVWFCRPCAAAGAVLRLCCVVGCSLVVPVLCVLLPVLRRPRGVFCVLPGAVWHACVGLGSFPVLLPPVAVAWSPVAARGCVLSWGAVLLCSGGRLSYGVVLSVSCLAGGAALFRSRRPVLCVVACRCQLFVAGSGCLLLFSAGVCCRACSCLAAWPTALLCAVVCCGAPLLCGVSCVLWCCVAVWCRAVPPCRFPLLVVLVCVLSLRVRCCVALRVGLFGADVVCAVVGASCCAVSLCVVVSSLPLCGLAVLLWCVVVS